MGLFDWLFGKKGTGNCPACKESMGQEEYEGVTIDRCPTCQGTWLDKGELETIIETRDKTFSTKMIVKLKVLSEWKVAGGESSSVDRHCPRCDKVMKTLNYAQLPGLQIERCQASCGVWLDRNELEKIQVYEENR